MKTEQEWYYIKKEYLNPVFDFVSITNKTLSGERETNKVDDLPITNVTKGDSHLHYDFKTGAV